jgi:hypothetical protein
MSTLNAYQQLTLTEVAKRKNPDNSMAGVVEALNEENLIIQDAIWREANDTFSNKTVRRSALPSGSWRKLNEGVAVEASITIELMDTIGMLETWSENDIEVINAFPNPKQARNDEAMTFIEGLGQTMAATMIYGNSSTTPEKFTGLAPRMPDITATTNVINEGGSGNDVTSIYVVDWGPTSVYMVYPKGSMAGLEHEDRGVETATDSSNNKYRAYVDVFTWKAGMVVKNSKSIGRVANIEPDGASDTFDEDNLITLLNRMTKGAGRRIYCNQDILTQVEIRAKDKTNIAYTTVNDIAPGPVTYFKGVPFRLVEQIVNTETDLT